MSAVIAAVSESEIARFCQRWHIRELALFGSALRSDFGPDSDVDVLVTFSPKADWGRSSMFRCSKNCKRFSTAT